MKHNSNALPLSPASSERTPTTPASSSRTASSSPTVGTAGCSPTLGESHSPSTSGTSSSSASSGVREDMAAAAALLPVNTDCEDDVYGSGPIVFHVYYRLCYITDQEPLTSVRRVTVRLWDRLETYHTRRMVTVAVVKQDAKQRTRFLDHLPQKGGQKSAYWNDGYSDYLTMFFSRRHEYYWTEGSCHLPFPASHWSNPLEASVRPPQGYVPKKPWPRVHVPSKWICDVTPRFDTYDAPWWWYDPWSCVNRSQKTLTQKELEENYWDILGIKPPSSA
eukprot:jgi/Chlat1/5824/Chrsp4S06284